MLFDTRDGTIPGTTMPIGTAFGIVRPGLLLTAAHVLRDIDSRSLRVVYTYCRKPVCYRVDKVERHCKADVAALVVREMAASQSFDHFGIGFPSDVYPQYSDFPLAEEVLAYGFPMVGCEKPIRPRMMKGHIQAEYQHTSGDASCRYKYKAYELSFPAFPGLSGAPVFRDWNERGLAIGIVTDRISYITEQGQHETKAYLALAAALHPIADWVRRIGRQAGK